MKSEILGWCSAVHASTQIARRVLAERYPVIALALARQDGNTTLLAINAAIDRGEPIDTAVVTLVGVSPPALACLENVVPEEVTESWLKCPLELLWAMDVLHPLDIPQTPEEWGVLRSLWINTGLEEDDAYRNPAGISRERQFVLEYLFRGLCVQGYGELVLNLANRLVAVLPGIETDPERIWPFSCYVSFAEEVLTRTNRRKHAESLNGAKHFLVRFSPAELIRQWECWRYVIAAHGDAGIEIVLGPSDINTMKWILQAVMPNLDEAARWLMSSDANCP